MRGKPRKNSKGDQKGRRESANTAKRLSRVEKKRRGEGNVNVLSLIVLVPKSKDAMTR